VLKQCAAMSVEISAIEAIPAGGTRLVCSSSEGAETVRTRLRTKLIKGDVQRTAFRPTRPLW
jgi:hypothetical protein